MKKTFLRLFAALSAIALTAAGQTHITMMVHTNGTLETPTNFFTANSNLLNESISLTATGVQVTSGNSTVTTTNGNVVAVGLAAARAQRGMAALVQGLQQMILSDGTNAFADLVEGAFFAPGQNQGAAANLIGLKGSLGTGVNVVQTNGGYYLNGSTSEIVFSNIPPQHGPLTGVVWITGMGWNQTEDAVPMGVYHTNGADENGLEVFYDSGEGGAVNGFVGDEGQSYEVANTGNFYPNDDYSTPYFISFQSDLQTILGTGFSGANNGVITNTQFKSYSFDYPFTTYPLGKIVLGAALLTNTTYGNNFNGVISGFLLFSNYLSSAQLLQVQALAYNTVSPLRRLIFTGDSLTVGWWNYAVTNYPFWGNASYVLNGINGQPLEWMTQNFYDRQGTNFQNGNDVIWPATELFWGGTDNTFSDTGAQAYVYVANEVANVHSLGARIFVSTMMETTNTGMGGATLTYQQALNALIRANTAGADGIVDNDQMWLGIVGTNYWTNTTYFADGIHCTTLGYSYIATNWGIGVGTNFWTPNNYFVGYPQVPSQLAVNPTNINSTLPTNNLPGDLAQISTDNLANGIDGNASTLFGSGLIPELYWLSTGHGTASAAIVNNAAGNAVPTNVLPAVSGANLTSLSGSAIASGTVATNYLPGDLPQISYDNLANGTNLNASKLASGTVPLARLNSAVLTNNEAAATTFAGNVTVPTLDSTLLVNVLSFSSDGAQFYSDGAGDVYAPAFVSTNAGGFGFVGNGASLTNLNASKLQSGTVAAARLPVASSSAFGVVEVDGTTITASAGVISAVGGGGGSSPTFSSQFDNIGGHTNISVAVNLTNIQLSGGATLAGGVTNSSTENVQGGLGVGTLTPPGNGSIVATNNVNVGGTLTATNAALYWSGTPTFSIMTGAGSFLSSGASYTLVSGSVDCAGHIVFVNGAGAATNANGNIIGTFTFAHTAANTNYQVLFGAEADTTSAWKLQQAYLTATNITTTGFAIAVTGNGAQSFSGGATWGTVYAVYPPVP